MALFYIMFHLPGYRQSNVPVGKYRLKNKTSFRDFCSFPDTRRPGVHIKSEK